jgi:DNA-binding NtrC family response regulator
LQGIVFVSDAMERTVEMACRVARANVPVLITGPNGAGKERIAQIVHANSSVAKGPFVAINCGAVPPDLIEAELFGTEAGAYTSATKAREGRFELADGGTLFLDEIGNLPLAGQVKLLRVLETGQYERLGSSRTRTAQVRVLSATNAALPQMIRDGSFREDLFYRLNLIEIALPPLAERPEDIPVLAAHFLGKGYHLSDDALAALAAHAWPGNVRELRNVIERARLLCANRAIHAADLNLPPSQRAPRQGDEPDSNAIGMALQGAAGNISRAAQALGLSRQALYRRMERLGMKT